MFNLCLVTILLGNLRNFRNNPAAFRKLVNMAAQAPETKAFSVLEYEVCVSFPSFLIIK